MKESPQLGRVVEERRVAKGGFEEPRCKQACPAGIDVPRYIRLIREERFAEALGIIREKVPFPLVCGYVCPRFCEAKCRRAEVDEPIAINALKRFVADKEQIVTKQKLGKSTGKRVAVVGSGPAGLTAAYYLAKVCGHTVTVFEAAAQAGGMLRAGIPRFLLPQEALDKEIEEILSSGIELRLNSPVEDVNQLFNDGYDATLLAIGLQEGRKLPIPGNDLNGVLLGLDFLRDINEGKKVKLGQNVMVLGAGGVACDVARVAKRLGVAQVAMSCLECRETIPAFPQDIKHAGEEGIRIFPSRSFKQILGENGRVKGIECLQVKWMEFDEEGRLQLETFPNSEHVLEADTVIFATGQALNRQWANKGRLELSRRGTIRASLETLKTNLKGVFTAGDCTTGPGTVIEAIAMGRKAAINIDKYLGGEGIIDEVFVPEEGVAAQSWEEWILETPRQQMPLLDSVERTNSFKVVELGFIEEMARREAERCLCCDLSLPITIDPAKCIQCYRCQLICSLVYQHAFNLEKARIINYLPEGIHYSNECIGGCSLCTKYCPTEAISLSNRTAGIE